MKYLVSYSETAPKFFFSVPPPRPPPPSACSRESMSTHPGVRRKTAANLFFASGCAGVAGEEDRNGQTIPAKPLPAFDSLPYAREYLKVADL